MKVAVIGTGNMGKALVEGMIRAGAHAAEEIYLYDKDIPKCAGFAKMTGCHACLTPKEAVDGADAVLLSVKPQVMKTAVGEFRESIKPGTLIISIAAGININTLRKMLRAEDIPVVRVMPNTPALVGEGASALCFSEVPDGQEKYVMNLFETCGIAVKVDETAMDAVTGLSGSGPAYGMIFIEAMADAGVDMGLDRETAVRLAAKTLKGAAAMVLETGRTPGELKDQVCSPGGTTIEAVRVFENAGFREIVIDAVRAAAKRSREISEELSKQLD